MSKRSELKGKEKVMPRINGEELDNRWREFLSEIRRAVAARHSQTNEDTMQAIKEAQDKITKWFAQQGIELIIDSDK